LLFIQAVIYFGYLLRYKNVLKGRDHYDYWTLCLYWHGVFCFGERETHYASGQQKWIAPERAFPEEVKHL